ACVTAREGMRVAVPLRRVEQQDMVGIGHDGFALLRAPKHTPAYQHDAVRRVRLFGPIGGVVSAAAEIDDGNAERCEQPPSRVWWVRWPPRKNFQASVVHTPNTRSGAPRHKGTRRQGTV